MINRNITYKTLEEYIKTLDGNLRIDTFVFDKMQGSLVTDVLPQYLTYLEYKLTDEEISKYTSNPKKLSFDLYGSPDLWFVICNANGTKRSLEFTPPRIIKLPSNESISRLISAFNNLRSK